jgi:hypothetical protein
MSDHLTHEELIDALDETLVPACEEHLENCRRCRAELADLAEVLKEVKGVEAESPSPLFWHHFSERVREATAGEPGPVAPWWRPWWRTVGVAAGAIGAVAAIILLWPLGARHVSPLPESTQAVDSTPVTDDGSWGLVIDLASELDVADVRAAVKPAEGTADAMIAELTPEQRSSLARLLSEDLGER